MLLTLKIVPAKELTQPSRTVDNSEFGEDLKIQMCNMAETMYAHSGVGLSGVQIGDSRQILVMDYGYARASTYGSEGFLSAVNPVIIESSVEASKITEGCLSYPWLEDFVVRPEWVIIQYKTPLGEEITEKFVGYEARIILHEMDHFRGVTLLTRMSALKRKKYNKRLIDGLNLIANEMRKRA